MPQTTQPIFRKPQATKPVCNRIEIVFDFDDTLAHDKFRQQQYNPLKSAGWGHVVARLVMDGGQFRKSSLHQSWHWLQPSSDSLLLSA